MFLGRICHVYLCKKKPKKQIQLKTTPKKPKRRVRLSLPPLVPTPTQFFQIVLIIRITMLRILVHLTDHIPFQAGKERVILHELRAAIDTNESFNKH